MKVLVIPSWYPDENDKLLGIYHKEYATAISNNNIDVDMLYISRIGISKIFKYPFMMKKQIDNEKTYNIGETCTYGKSRYVIFECIKESTGNPPVTKFYDNIPYDLGYHDSIWRVTKYIQDRFTYIENEIIKL